MSRSAQWLSVVAVVFLTSAITITYAPQVSGADSPDTTPLWVIGVLAFAVALFVDTGFARTRIPFLRSAAVETQQLLGRAALEGQRLLGALNAYHADELDTDAQAYWRDAVQGWTTWTEGVIGWRLPHLRSNFANEAGRDQAAFVGIAWQRHLQTWLQVRMERLNEYILMSQTLQHKCGPKPSEADLRVPEWDDPPTSQPQPL